jgi:hypothetical protein
MSKDNLGKAGGRQGELVKQPMEAGTPKTGFDSAPRGDFNKFEPLHGHGGSNPGAH